MQANIQTDDMDARIISALGADGRRSYADVGAEEGLSTAAVHERVKKLLDKGAIRRFSISVAGEHDFLAKIRPTHARGLEDVLYQIKAIPGVARTTGTVVLNTEFEDRPLDLGWVNGDKGG